jgi:hypothetical protein
MSRHLDALSELIDSIQRPIWCCGPTAAALEGMDGFILEPPFHLVALHGRKMHRFGHHIHVSRSLDNIDRCTSLGFPRPDTQQVLTRRGDRLVRVDAHFVTTDVVVEVLGYRWHRSRMQMQVDAERVNALQLAGFVVLQFTYADVVSAAPRMFTELRAARSGLPRNAA